MEELETTGRNLWFLICSSWVCIVPFGLLLGFIESTGSWWSANPWCAWIICIAELPICAFFLCNKNLPWFIASVFLFVLLLVIQFPILCDSITSPEQGDSQATKKWETYSALNAFFSGLAFLCMFVTFLLQGKAIRESHGHVVREIEAGKRNNDVNLCCDLVRRTVDATKECRVLFPPSATSMLSSFEDGPSDKRKRKRQKVKEEEKMYAGGAAIDAVHRLCDKFFEYFINCESSDEAEKLEKLACVVWSILGQMTPIYAIHRSALNSICKLQEKEAGPA